MGESTSLRTPPVQAQWYLVFFNADATRVLACAAGQHLNVEVCG